MQNYPGLTVINKTNQEFPDILFKKAMFYPCAFGEKGFSQFFQYQTAYFLNKLLIFCR